MVCGYGRGWEVLVPFHIVRASNSGFFLGGGRELRRERGRLGLAWLCGGAGRCGRGGSIGIKIWGGEGRMELVGGGQVDKAMGEKGDKVRSVKIKDGLRANMYRI